MPAFGTWWGIAGASCALLAVQDTESMRDVPRVEEPYDSCAPPAGWTAVDVPEVALDPASHTATAEEAERIRGWIDALVEVEDALPGASATRSGAGFAPLGLYDTGAVLLGVDHGRGEAEELTRLVDLGPKALPFLLDALDDARPTAREVRHGYAIGAMWHGLEAERSTACAAETRAAAAHPGICEQDVGSMDDDERSVERYRVTVGDLCFVALGQITNRGYQAVRYQPTACVVVNSPTSSPELAAYVRAAWAADASAEGLAERLLVDFATTGRTTTPGRSADQTAAGAVTRLLHYFPDETASVVAARIAALVPPDGEPGAPEPLEDARGLSVRELLLAARPFDLAPITAAQRRVLAYTDEPYRVAQCASEAVAREHPDELRAGVLRALASPPDERFGFAAHFELLTRCREVLTDPREAFAAAVARGEAELTAVALGVLARVEPTERWVVELVVPLLDDRSPVDLPSAHPRDDRDPVRVSDFAAALLSARLTGATFERAGTHAERDVQIEALRARAAAFLRDDD